MSPPGSAVKEITIMSTLTPVFYNISGLCRFILQFVCIYFVRNASTSFIIYRFYEVTTLPTVSPQRLNIRCKPKHFTKNHFTRVDEEDHGDVKTTTLSFDIVL